MGQERSPWLWLERAANVGIVVGLALLVWHLRASPQGRPVRPDLVEAGDKVTIHGSSGPRSSGQLLVVFRASCAFCVGSLPFYKELLGMGVPDGLAFVSPPGEAAATLDALRSAGLRDAPVLAADFGQNRFHVTPLILFVDEDRKVRALWRGQLSRSAQTEVRLALEAIAGGRQPVASLGSR
jgi:hypothetical protein